MHTVVSTSSGSYTLLFPPLCIKFFTQKKHKCVKMEREQNGERKSLKLEKKNGGRRKKRHIS